MERVVFVGKQQACDCTNKRIALSWASPQKALEDTEGVVVDRLAVDVAQEWVQECRQLRSFLVLPVVYLLDEEGRARGDAAERGDTRAVPRRPLPVS